MKHQLYGLSLAVTLLASASPASASTWVNIGKNSYDSVYDVDWDSIRRDGSIVTFTLRVHYGPGVAGAGQANGYLAHRRADCANKTYADLQTDYMIDETVKNSTGLEEKRDVKPGSIAADVFDKVCAH